MARDKSSVCEPKLFFFWKGLGWFSIHCSVENKSSPCLQFQTKHSQTFRSEFKKLGEEVKETVHG